MPTENSKTCIHDTITCARNTSNNEQKMKYWALRVYMNLLFAKQNSNKRSPVRIHVQYPTVHTWSYVSQNETSISSFRNKPSIHIALSFFCFVRYLSFLFYFYLINKTKVLKSNRENNEYESHYTLYFISLFY